MKKFAKEELAPIPERNGLKAKEVSLKALEEKGLGIVSYGVQKGEVIEFLTPKKTQLYGLVLYVKTVLKKCSLQ